MIGETIKFGTDGWRAIIAKEYTVYNVARVTYAVAQWVKKESQNPQVIVGHDCRFGGEMFTQTVAQVLISQGVKVLVCKGYVTTPMISMATRGLDCTCGVVITASHNPSTYNGYKLKANFGGPMQEAEIKAIEGLIPGEIGNEWQQVKLTDHTDMVEYPDVEQLYVEAVKKNFDLEAIQKSGMRLAYDAMYGSGQGVMKKILPNIDFFRCEENPSFNGIAPEPIMKNLGDFSRYIKAEGNIDCGLVTDGDADRIGLMNGNGEFVDSHHIILLLIHYLYHYKGLTGKVVTAFSSVSKINQLCEHYGLDLEIVKIGFKYAAGIIVREQVLVGGEESGGIAIDGHIPERDGIWMGLTLWEFMAKSGKSLDELIQEVYDLVGAFNFRREDLRIDPELKAKIVQACYDERYTQFGKYSVIRIEDMDGWKFHLGEDQWVMIRPSGTEPVLRVYAQAPDARETEAIISATKQTIL